MTNRRERQLDRRFRPRVYRRFPLIPATTGSRRDRRRANDFAESELGLHPKECHPLSVPPYDIRRQGSANEWTVVDTATGEIAWVDGVLQAGLSLDQASAVSKRLNNHERARPPAGPV